MITPSIAPHSVYTLDAKTLSAVSALAKRLMIPIQIHLAETSAEIGMSQERHKMRPVAILDSLNFWAPTTLGAHGVWINDDEIAVLKRHNVGISNNPESNMKLSSGTAPVMKYRKAGVNVGIGTDGAASNNDLDMFEAMRQAAFQQKLVTMDPTAISAAEALEMAHPRRRPRPRPACSTWDRSRPASSPTSSSSACRSRASSRCSIRSRRSFTRLAATMSRRRS